MSVAHETSTITLSDWDREWSHDERVHELVKGVPTVAPRERLPNIRAAVRLAILVDRVAGAEFEGVPGIEILITQAPPTVRRPDLVILRTNLQETAYRLPPSAALAVVEVVSPSTARIDQVEKVGEYARAGIPAYLMIDVRDADSPTMTLLTQPKNGTYERRDKGGSLTLPVGNGIPVDIWEIVGRADPTSP